MKWKPTKKMLKNGHPLQIMQRVEGWAFSEDNQYQCSIEDYFKLWIETTEEYIDIHFNYGYSITNIQVKKIEDPIFGSEYRCRATIEKL
jgi:hypothetical protein